MPGPSLGPNRPASCQGECFGFREDGGLVRKEEAMGHARLGGLQRPEEASPQACQKNENIFIKTLWYYKIIHISLIDFAPFDTNILLDKREYF